MMWSATNSEAQMTWRRVFSRIPVLFTALISLNVCRYLWEHTLPACIRLRYTGPSRGEVVWNVIGYSSRSPLVRIDGPLNSDRYIYVVLRLVALPNIGALRNATFLKFESSVSQGWLIIQSKRSFSERFRGIKHDWQFPVLYRSFLIQKTFCTCPVKYVP